MSNSTVSRRHTLPKKIVSLFSSKTSHNTNNDDDVVQKRNVSDVVSKNSVNSTSKQSIGSPAAQRHKKIDANLVSPVSSITSSFSGLSLNATPNNNNANITIHVDKYNSTSNSTLNSNNSTTHTNNNSNVNSNAILSQNSRSRQNNDKIVSNSNLSSTTNVELKLNKNPERMSSNHSQSGNSIKTSTTPAQSSSNLNLEAVTSNVDHVSLNSSSNSQTQQPTATQTTKRFVLHENGSHTHSLKATRRQEKLRNMLKNILGSSDEKIRGQAKSAVPEIMKDTKNFVTTEDPNPPTLLAGLVKQVEIMKKDTSSTNLQNSNNSVNPTQSYSSLTTISSHQSDIIPFSGASYGGDKIIYKNQFPTDYQDEFIKSFMNKKDSLSFGEKYGRCQEVIGKGAFGVVKLCHKKDPNNSKNEIVYAVKEFKRTSTEPIEKYSKRLIAEFCISSSLRHTNIIDAFDLFQDANGDYREVLEYCSGGDLFTLIIAAGKLEVAEADCFFKQLIRGVSYMHGVGVCHRDLKPENLLLTASGVLKITDFGNAECFKIAWEKDIHLSAGVCGSSPYIAPEEFIKEEFDPRPVDIWACGVIYMAMTTGRQLWSSATRDDIFFCKYYKSRKETGKFTPIESLQRTQCRNVIYSMLDPNPTGRLTPKQILQTEWGRDIKCCNEGLPKKLA
ncbi:hypothetical protein TPHA_0O01030 [Tetrapisispora phaffii CBS 4417]|uniref:non-specific serine/threonine protein kinase n=1 Tax=Tetrapisispora phaffii (strain ATCC 24235 / CBS 4417 / NBRC 1672 / NRRL Y-8282 / UCD 70-5) TaxID=1071381 RepID=G8C1P4_TETPH|nr:hypothetical protein TPHA_0O01030 [Tetrapisispora phaffii CBS 4417]CCE66072.1 hypothetical protein TPHA_0O01030 [Tetrapisispora phaffii CBS 4417]